MYEQRNEGHKVALPKIGFNEGSLLRRTLLHVGTFLVGSVAFIGIVSFVLVSIAQHVVSPRAEGADDEAEVGAAPGASGAPALAGAPTLPGAPKAAKPKAPRGRRPLPTPAVPAQPSKDE